MTNSQMNEIEQKLKMERESKLEIINSAKNNRNSVSPEINKKVNNNTEGKYK